MNCPACQFELEPWTDPSSRLEIDSCPRCRGFWFDGEELSRLFPSPDLLQRVVQLEQQAPAPARKVAERPCPRCQTALKLTRALEVEIDVCRRCRGIWLDAGELKLLAERYPGNRAGDLMVLNQVGAGLAGADPRVQALDRLLKLLDPSA